MNNIRQGYAKILMRLINHMLRNLIALGGQAIDLFDSQALHACARHTFDGRLRFWMLNGEAYHGTDDSPRRSDGFQVSTTSTGAARTIFFHQHMSNFTSSTRYTMINTPISYQCTADATSQSDIEHSSLSNATAEPYFSQCRGISIIVYNARNIEPLRKIILQGEIIPPMSVIQRSHHAPCGIYQPPNSDTHAQDTPIGQ